MSTASELGPLVGAPFLEGVLTLSRWEPTRLSGWHTFQFHWEHAPDHITTPSVMEGIYSRGGRFIAPWGDMALRLELHCPRCSFKTTLTEHNLESLFTLWNRVIPWNGHISVEYESPCHTPTLMSLKCGVPPVLTPLGYAAYFGGFTGGYKDWYIAEGGHEGPRKLQSNKPLDLDHLQASYTALKSDVMAFLHRSNSDSRDALLSKATRRAHCWLDRATLLIEAMLQ